MSFDLAAYLDRLGLSAITPDVAGLQAAQQAQMRAIPFENLDPLLGVIPGLGIGEVFDKIVLRRRGGYCFELNGLFEAGLRAAGFLPTRMLARVRMRTGADGPRSHLILRVESEGRCFLADAGFGGPGPLMPIDLSLSSGQETPNGIYRVVEDAARGETVLERRDGADWKALYAFDTASVSDGDIAAANYVCATWHEAPFSSHAMLGCYRGEARLGLFDRDLTVETDGRKEQRRLASEREFSDLVCGDMGIAFEPEDLARVWEKITQQS